MARYLSQRLLKGILTIFVSVTLTFFILRLIPSDPVSLMIDPKMGPEVKAAMMAQMGLDKPIGQQYLIFLGNLLKGDMGISFASRQPVTTVIMQKLPWTLLLMAIVIFFSVLIGIPIGVWAARRQGQALDRFVGTASMLGISIFIPFLSFALLFVFSYVLKILPTGGAYTPPPAQGLAYVLDVARHAALPALTLFINEVASIVLYTRSSMLEVLKEDYMRTARSKGWGEGYVIWAHGLRNAMIPTATVTGLMVISMMGGAVMTETVYAWPGVGRLIYDSVNALDYPVLQGAFLILSVTVVVIGILTDLIVAWLDPRIKLGS